MIITTFEVEGHMLTVDTPRITEHWDLRHLVGYQTVMPPASGPNEPWTFTLTMGKQRPVYHLPAADADDFDILLNKALQVNARGFSRQLEQISEQVAGCFGELDRVHGRLVEIGEQIQGFA